jgi:ABC-type bacteriocin/lantibiotic exporter with double-glycine peptidase domain
MAQVGEATAEKDDIEVQKAIVPSGPPPFSFFRELGIMNKQIFALSDYPFFLFKWICLQLLTISGSVSFLVFTVVYKELDLNKMTTELYIWFAFIGVLQVISRVSPFCNSLIIDQLKGSLQVAHGTSVIRKIFEMEHDSMISTPTGKFGQLISKIFMNVDKLLPALYGGVLSTILNLLVGVILLGIFFGPISLALIVLYIAFTIAAYRSAKQTAIRNKDMMTAMFSEWGKLLAIASSYERAHFFDRVDYEVSNAEKSFQIISTKMSAVMQGAHISSSVLQIISTGITVLCVAVIIPALANNATSLELIGLFFYFFTFVGSLEKYASDLTELRSALFEAQALSEFVKSQSKVIDQPNAVKMPLTPNPSIEFRNVSFSYQDKNILNQVSFKIEGGQTLGLVGASGCGKSTILRLLLRFYRPTTGSILINGVDIQTMTGASLRRAFSVVTQTSRKCIIVFVLY